MIATVATLVLIVYATALWLGVYPGERTIARVQRGLRSARRPLGSVPALRDLPANRFLNPWPRVRRTRTRGPPPAPLVTTQR